MKAAELRQSILQAAVQGNLVPQNLHDEPASELIKRIRQEKARLVKEGKIKKEKPLPSITENEILYDLPDGWVWCRLSDLVSFYDNSIRRGPFGSAIRKDMFVPYSDDVYKIYEQGNAIRKTVNYGTYYISKEQYSKLKSFAVIPGDIIISCAGTLGETFVIPDDAPKGIINQALLKLNINHAIMSIDFFIIMFKAIIQRQIVLSSLGSAMKNLTSIVWLKESVVFPLPPLAEQQRIVTKVDELMALCDEFEAAEKELDELEIHFAEFLPKSILQAAVQGKIVPQNVHDETASELLKRIKQEKSKLVKEGKIKKEKPLPPIAEDEIPYDLPDGWVWCRLGDVCTINPRNQITDDTEVSFTPMALISNVYFEGHKQELRQWGEVKNGFTHYAENDVVVAKITPCFQNGKSCIMQNLRNGYGAGTTELHVLRSIEVQPAYILIYVKHPEFLLEGERNMTGTAGQQRVPTEYLKRCLFPLPPLAEQQRIVAKVDELMALCDELKNARNLLIKPATSNVVPFQPKEENVEELLIAARGDASQGLSNKAQHDADELLGD